MLGTEVGPDVGDELGTALGDSLALSRATRSRLGYLGAQLELAPGADDGVLVGALFGDELGKLLRVDEVVALNNPVNTPLGINWEQC